MVTWQPFLTNWDNIFTTTKFWDQIWKLPIYAYSKLVALMLWTSLKHCLQVQIRDSAKYKEKYFHLCLRLEISQPF